MIDNDDETKEGNEQTLASFSFSSTSDAPAEQSNEPPSPLRLRVALIQQLQQLRSSVLIQCVREVGNDGWDLETLV